MLVLNVTSIAWHKFFGYFFNIALIFNSLLNYNRVLVIFTLKMFLIFEKKIDKFDLDLIDTDR